MKPDAPSGWLGRIQFVWWGWRRWWPLLAVRRWPGDLGRIFSFSVLTGPLEWRVWKKEMRPR